MEIDHFRASRFYPLQELDSDTPFTPKSWQAACAAAGTVIAAVHSVCSGETRIAFCAVRPPGHHVGTWGPCQFPRPEGHPSLQETSSQSEEDWM